MSKKSTKSKAQKHPSSAGSSRVQSTSEFRKHVTDSIRFIRDIVHLQSQVHQETVPHAALELAFVIQDPCGSSAINLARMAVELLSNRTDAECSVLLIELQKLNGRFSRRHG